MPSPNGKYVAYGVAQGGSEETTIYVWDVAAAKELLDVIDRIETAYTEPQWLPDGSGLDIIRELRDQYAGRSIALTGYGMESNIAASRQAGFAEHLTKPVDLAALDAAIRRVSGSVFRTE